MSTPEWRVRGGSATGTTHVAVGSGCQDSHAWLVDSSSVSCFAVADGAGSRHRSAEGSAAAVRAAVELARNAGGDGEPCDPLTVERIFIEARRRLDELAARTGAIADDLATTLAVVVATGDRIEVGQVGDSIVIIRDSDGSVHAASPAEKFEYANETVFITSRDWSSHLRRDSYELADVTAVVLSTDGLRFKILDDLVSGRPYEPFFEDLVSYVESEEASSDAVARFLDGLDDQSGDDKTLVVAVKSQVPTTLTTPVLVVNEFSASSAARNPTPFGHKLGGEGANEPTPGNTDQEPGDGTV